MQQAVRRRIFIAILILIWFQFALLPYISIRNVKPDLFFIFLAFYAFQIDRKTLPMLGFILGLIRDLCSNTFFGLETASVLGGSVVLYFLAARFDREKFWIQIASLFTFSFLTLTLFAVLAMMIQPNYGLNEMVLSQILLITIYTSVFGVLLFPFLNKWLLRALSGKQYELF